MESIEQPPLNPLAAKINSILLNDELPRFGKCIQLQKLFTKENVEAYEQYLRQYAEQALDKLIKVV